MKDCHICDRLGNGEGIQLRGANHNITEFLGLLNLDCPKTPGHILIVPKKHFECLHDFNPHEDDDFLQFLKSATKYIENPNFKELYHHAIHYAQTANEREVAFMMLNHPLINKVPNDYRTEFIMGLSVKPGRHWQADLIPVDY